MGRCYRNTGPRYERYGGRGITVCERWRNSFDSFVVDMGAKPSPEYQIDRIDNDKGYWCGKCQECVSLGRAPNCRWLTPIENQRNRPDNIYATINGERLLVREWCKRLGVKYGTVVGRHTVRGMSYEEALTTPVETWRASPRGKTVLVAMDGVTKSVNAWARDLGVHRSVVYRRIARGMTPEAAIAMGPGQSIRCPYRCSSCGAPGHNARTCTKLAKAA